MIPLPTIDVLDSITIPVSCPVPWDTMHGNERTRFCNKCSQNVHDVSELTREEAVQLVTGSEKLCARLYKRQDGRVMTSDCATKRERVWKWLGQRSGWAAAVFALAFMGCKPAILMGAPLPPPQLTPEETAIHQDEEQANRRQHVEELNADHTTSESHMNPDAKAGASARHEAAAER